MSDDTKHPDLALADLSCAALAYLGDSVLELCVRNHLVRAGLSTAAHLNKASRRYVTATAQAQAMQREICDVATAFLAENGVFVSDGVMDAVYTARRNHDGVDTIFTMNYSGKDITRSFTRPDGSVFETEVKDLSIVEYK